jgi:hypothetical protein
MLPTTPPSIHVSMTDSMSNRKSRLRRSGTSLHRWRAASRQPYDRNYTTTYGSESYPGETHYASQLVPKTDLIVTGREMIANLGHNFFLGTN